MITADYVAAGIISPDATGNYHLQGTFGGQPYYRSHPSGFFILWDSVNLQYIISATLEDDPANRWTGLEASILGDYASEGAHTGTANVTAAP